MTAPDGLISSFAALMILKPQYIPLFTFAYFINPYSYYIWFSGKNKLKEERLQEIYGKKQYYQRFLTYTKYIMLSTLFYGMNIYF